jgi:hypothetical protein
VAIAPSADEPMPRIAAGLVAFRLEAREAFLLWPVEVVIQEWMMTPSEC